MKTNYRSVYNECKKAELEHFSQKKIQDNAFLLNWKVHAKIQALLKEKNSPKKVTYVCLAPSHSIVKICTFITEEISKCFPNVSDSGISFGKLEVHFVLTPFSLIRDFRKQNTCGNLSKISVNHTRCWQIRSKSTNHSPLAWCKEGLNVTLVAVIGGFWSDLLITHKTDGNFGNVSVGVLFSKVCINENVGKLVVY